MIRLENVRVLFQGRYLLSDVNWQITEKSRIGLVGVNGSGKSTLLRLISGILEPEDGNIFRARNFSIGYLPQELTQVSDRTVFEEAQSGCGTVLELEKKIELVTKALEEADHESEDYEELVFEYGRLHRMFEAQDGFTAEARTSRVLQGLAVPEEWWSVPLKQLSGGWQMRVHLARLVLSAPSLLLLDEPTNHLDLESILWLSDFLRTYEGGLILISHDRYFMDENIAQVVEIWNQKLHFYTGNYSKYVEEKKTRQELLENAYRNQQEEIARIQGFVDRFRYKATKAKQVQSRIKMLEKMERIELPLNTDQIRLRLPSCTRSGRTVVEAENLSHRYDEKEVFQNLNLRIERGEKVALLGVNGAGKSTLLKILAGILEPSGGEVKPGHNVFRAYYAQVVTEQMDIRNNVLQETIRESVSQTETELRSILGSFLFSGEDVYKKVSVLSGGEKSRLALAKILLKPANFLLLDEPTNHLDLASKTILLEALQNFEGTILFIAHDRYFMDQLATRILELKNGQITDYPGNYSYYLTKSAELQNDIVPPASSPRKPQRFHKTKEHKKSEAEKRNRATRMKREILEPLSRMEEMIAEAEEEQRRIEAALEDDRTYSDPGKYQDHLEAYEKIRADLKKYYAEWEKLQKQKEAVEAEVENAYN